MKSFLSSTIGERKLARNFYGVYRHQSMQMLKFSIHEDKGDLFEQLAMQALLDTPKFVGHFALKPIPALEK